MHVLPSGAPPRRAATWANLRYRDLSRTRGGAETAYRATRDYLAANVPGPDRG